jgi:hypothetical protein
MVYAIPVSSTPLGYCLNIAWNSSRKHDNNEKEFVYHDQWGLSDIQIFGTLVYSNQENKESCQI